MNPNSPFEFDDEQYAQTPGGPGPEDSGQDEEPIEANESDSPGENLVPSSKLSAEDLNLTALASALEQEAKEEQEALPPMLRKGTLKDPIRKVTSKVRLIEFINNTRRLTKERIEERVVNESIPLMIWKLREFALAGAYTEARAVEIWLNWAEKIQSRPKKAAADKSVLKNGALFDATLTTGQVLEAQATPIGKKTGAADPDATKRSRSGNFSRAGEEVTKGFPRPNRRKK